ncbi:50S ribosomal protein L14e [Candidatus Marsarchaeota archaeon]|jgi:ribosomal protein L14E/L6E/L27E|nr:50S ribosomal protein L14e [Candidatus Marsarchaeota archaeon]MCL5092317.1 50S ribosomal protein L14e [Candidatus Marsarchaeota archaeon]
MLLETGRVCIKKYGRDAGSRAVIMSIEKDGFVKIMSSKRQKERRCNPNHLEFLNEVVDVKSKDLVNKTLGIESNQNEKHPKKQ